MTCRVLGLDGWRRGWVAVTLEDGAFAAATTHATVADALGAIGDTQAIAVDIPIGLPVTGSRRADIAARARLGVRRSSVFDAPPRDVIEAEPYAAANRLSKERYGRGLSRQSYALRDKILEVDALVHHDNRIFEVHPEVTFALLAGEPLPSKKTWAGVNRRRSLLGAAGIELPDELGAAGVVPVDDVLDAAAAAWSADRIARGVAQPIPADAELAGGRPMAIWV